jgi:hypothetical protein
MDLEKEEEIINLMTNVRGNLQNLINGKYDIIEKLQEEIEGLKIQIREIDKFISISSITTAEHLLDTETFLKEKGKNLTDVDFTRKIFSESSPKKMMVIFKYNGETIDIFFPNPNVTQITPVCNVYLNSIILPLMKLKDIENDMDIIIKNQNDEGEITKMEIKNVFSLENVDYIYEIFKNLISQMNN